MIRFSQVASIMAFGCYAVSLSGCNRESENSLSSQAVAQQSNAQKSVAVVPTPQTKPIGALPSRSLGDLKNATLVAYVNKDEALLQKLVYPNRVRPQEWEAFLDTVREDWQLPIKGVSDEPMNKGVEVGLNSVVDGQRYEASLKPLGIIRIGFIKSPTKQAWSPAGTLHPYGVKDGAYYLATAVRAK